MRASASRNSWISRTRIFDPANTWSRSVPKQPEAETSNVSTSAPANAARNRPCKSIRLSRIAIVQGQRAAAALRRRQHDCVTQRLQQGARRRLHVAIHARRNAAEEESNAPARRRGHARRHGVDVRQSRQFGDRAIQSERTQQRPHGSTLQDLPQARKIRHAQQRSEQARMREQAAKRSPGARSLAGIAEPRARGRDQFAVSHFRRTHALAGHAGECSWSKCAKHRRGRLQLALPPAPARRRCDHAGIRPRWRRHGRWGNAAGTGRI